MIDYAAKIREYRERAFLTQKELADRLGVTSVTVARWETRRYRPTMKIKRQLMSLFIEAGMKTFDDA